MPLIREESQILLIVNKAVDLLNKYLNLSKNEKLKMSLCSKTTFENKYKFERVEKDLLKIFKNN